MLDLLQACRQSKFLHFSLNNGIISDLRLTAIGQLLSGNLHSEWNRPGNTDGSSSLPIFFGKSNLSLKENIIYVQKQYEVTKLPFGITVEQKENNKRVMIGDAFNMELPETLELSTSYLLPTTMANQFLYQLQRQRKIWWMRLSVDPGRYFISDMRQTESSATSVSICARYLDRSDHKTEVELERLEMSLNEDIKLEFVKTSNTIVRISNNLTRAIVAILMDALEAVPMEQCVKIHRKIAPYKCGIIYQLEQQCEQDTALQQELIELSKHLSYVLRAAKLSVHDGSFDQLQYDHQLAQLDQIGVPYVLLLNAQTLHTGLLQLRARDTTLSETIHLSDLPDYLLKIINA